MIEKAVIDRVEMESPFAIAIMVDGWTDGHAHNPYVNLSTQYLTKDFVMRDWNLGIEPFERPHTGENLKNLIKMLLSKHNLGKKKLISVSDNAANMKLMAKLLECLEFFGCTSHNLHLLLMTDTLKSKDHQTTRDLINKVKKTHKSLSFKINEMKEKSLATKNLQLEKYLQELEYTIGKNINIKYLNYSLIFYIF